MPKVLVIEDEANVQKLLKLHLERENLDVTICSSGKEGLETFQKVKPDLVLLDWMLPDIAGIDVCKKIAGQCPILMLTARSSATDIVLGLEMGADDYITKPFEIAVLIARVRALLRRSQVQTSANSEEIFTLGKIKVNVPRVEVKVGGQEAKLTSSEFKLLVVLLRNQGRVISREKLKRHLQGDGTVVVDRVIDTHVCSLRAKIGDDGGKLIETIRGIGYRVKG